MEQEHVVDNEDVPLPPRKFLRALGGSSTDVGRALRLDANGNAYITGNTGSTNFPTTTGAYHRTKRGFTDGFVSKISP